MESSPPSISLGRRPKQIERRRVAGLELVGQDLGMLGAAREHDGVDERYADGAAEIAHHVEQAAAVADLMRGETGRVRYAWAPGGTASPTRRG